MGDRAGSTVKWKSSQGNRHMPALAQLCWNINTSLGEEWINSMLRVSINTEPHDSIARIGILVSQAGKIFAPDFGTWPWPYHRLISRNCPGVSLLPLSRMTLTSELWISPSDTGGGGCWPHSSLGSCVGLPAPKQSALGSELLGDHSNQCGESRVALSGAS